MKQTSLVKHHGFPEFKFAEREQNLKRFVQTRLEIRDSQPTLRKRLPRKCKKSCDLPRFANDKKK